MNARTIPIGKRLVSRALSAFGRLYAVSPRNLTEAIGVCRELAKLGVPSTLGKFGSANDSPEDITREYCTATSILGQEPKIDFYVSVKPPALAYRLDLLTILASTARSHAHGIHFDSHGHNVAQPTLDTLNWLIQQSEMDPTTDRPWTHSLTLSTRWRRTAHDAEWAIERGCRVRLVRGEFPASRSDEVEPTRSLLELINRLAGRVPEIAIGTHDGRLAEAALERGKALGASIELELLWGFPADRMIALAVKHDAPLRFYVPYGDALFVYGIRHLLANPHKISRGNYVEALTDLPPRIQHVRQALHSRPPTGQRR